MKKEIIVWALAVALVIAAIFVTKNYRLSTAGQSDTGTSIPTEVRSALAQEGASSAQSNARSKAPDFTLKDLNGNSVTLESLKGKVVYLNFWATWCPWCVKELPDVETVYKQYKDKDVVILAVDIGESEQDVRNYVNQYKYTFPVLLDTAQDVARQYGARSIPLSVFIDKNGELAQQHLGTMDESQMKANIDALLGEK